MREFDKGATRDDDDDKLDYDGFYHPLVMETFAKYMHKHRVQPDGNLRDSDNWWKLFGKEHKDVCMKSGFRHFMDWWMVHRGFPSRDGIVEALCGLIFNANAYLLKVILDNLKEKEEQE